MISSPDGKGVVVIGGDLGSKRKYSRAFLELKGTSSMEEWTFKKQRLKCAKKWPVVIPIPDNELNDDS